MTWLSAIIMGLVQGIAEFLRDCIGIKAAAY